MNEMVKEKQTTVLWHVDDLKTSHVDGGVNEDIVEKLNTRCGKETPVTVTRGDIHDHLGMTIDCGTDGKIRIGMDDCVENLLRDVPDDMAGAAATPAAANLFKADDAAKDLCCEEADIFHSLTARLLFLCERSRPDIQTPISFPCTRV
jgi:hypothetical protein